MRILHIIQQINQGGASRAMWNIAKYSARRGDFQHRALSLLRADPADLTVASQIGVEVVNGPEGETLLAEIAAADVVHGHLWNNPESYALMRSNLPPMRFLAWWHVAGDHPPQVLTADLVNYADFLVVGSPYTFELPVIQNLPVPLRSAKVGVVKGVADFERVSDLKPRAHDNFNVGYLGSVHFAKMHARYASMSASIEIPNVRFLVCGLGTAVDELKKQARELGAQNRFEFRGYIEDIRSIVEEFDVFGYPLCPGNYSTSEMVLEEMMFAGVPPVIFPYGGAQRTVIHNQTGLIVQSELEYKQAIEHLYASPAERRRLGQGAHDYARQWLGAQNSAGQVNTFYETLVNSPKRLHSWPSSVNGKAQRKWTGADNFVRSLGETAPQFRSSLYSQDNRELLQADRLVARSSPTLCNPGGGGLFHYQTYYPTDPYLQMWAGLVKFEHQQFIEAKAHFRTAIRLGGRHWRFYWYWLRSKFRT